jgi:hypothetical protein
VGMLVNFDEGGFRYNLSSVSSISVEYKSTGDIRLSLLQFGVTGTGAEYGIHLLPSSAYKNQTIQISQLKQPDWVSTTPERQAPLEMDKILGAKFELKSNTGGSGSVSIRKLVFNGFTPPEVLCEDYTAIGSDFSAKSSLKRVQINAQYTNGTLQISQPFSGNMQISLVGLNGKEVVQIHSGYTEAGLMIMPLQVPAGVYYIRAQSDLGVQVKQLFITQ